MKSIYLTTIVSGLLAVSLMSSCSESVNDIPHDRPVKELPPSASELSVKIAEGSKTATSVALSFVPSNSTDKYVSLVIPTSTFSTVKTAELSKLASVELTQRANDQHKTLSEYLKTIEHTGKFDQTVTGLTPFTNYNVVTFLRKGGDSLDVRVRNERFYFQTNVADHIELNFEHHLASVQQTSVFLSMKPSDKKQRYFICRFPKTTYDDFINVKKLKDADVISGVFNYQLMNSLQSGSAEEVKAAVEKMTLLGDQDGFQVSGLEAGTDYVYLLGAFAVPDYNHVTLISNVTKGTFKTADATKLIPMNFTTFDVTKTNETSFCVNIVPEDKGRTYIWRQGILTSEYKKMKPMEFANALLHQGFYPMPPFFLDRGVRKYCNLPIMPGNEYYVIAFGTDGRNVTSEPKMVTFMTGTPPDPAQTTFEIVKNKVGPYSANLTFKASSKGVYYAFALLKDSENKTAEDLKASFEKDIQYFSEQWLKVNKGHNMLDFISSNYFYGNQAFQFDDLTPNTPYSVYTLVLDNDGRVVKAERHKSFLTSPAVSEATVEPAVFGIFNIDEVTDDMVPGSSKYKGSNVALVVTKCTFKNGAVKADEFLMPKSFRETELNANKIPDAVVIKKVNGYAYHMTKEEPYGFFVCRLGETQASVAYGFDEHEVTGVVDRRVLVTPTKDNIQNIEKLKKLIASLPGDDKKTSTATTVASSKVLREQPKMLFPRKHTFVESYVPGTAVSKKGQLKGGQVMPNMFQGPLEMPIFIVVK